MKKPKAKAAEQFSDPGPKPGMAWLALDKLLVDERYQRQILRQGITHVNRLARSFVWCKFQPLTVAPSTEHKGRFAVVDGQHRLAAARRHPKITEVPCYIVAADDVAAQAMTFVGVNKDRIGVTRLNVFWASVAAGDVEAVRIKALCDRSKVKIARTALPVLPPCTTTATGALAKLLVLGDTAIADGLKLMVEAQGEVDGVFRACNIVAIVKMMGVHKGRLDRERLRSVLADLDLDDEIDKARGYRKLAGGSLEAALQLAITRAYNKGLAAKRLPEKFEDKLAA